MLKFWLYVIVLVILCVLGLTVGSANESLVTFDFLFVKLQLSLGMVMVVGIVIGIIVGLYISLLFSLKMWAKAQGAKSEAKRYKREASKLTENNTAA
ncbi:MAG: DUF1049 domain-containing protein [Candidatus Anaerobiospirillum pullicola]|uniref:DUF1049 domain-containing protein n=1 Tax=Candidatus Anaerobiospirillum pullicola TaxID=2838451 RepID=A0A948THK3_9GAMM|nr:DUF1049 domain-containing protein [Candidatus Anaerobiospirillum pullicola]